MLSLEKARSEKIRGGKDNNVTSIMCLSLVVIVVVGKVERLTRG